VIVRDDGDDYELRRIKYSLHAMVTRFFDVITTHLSAAEVTAKNNVASTTYKTGR
jgi:hypothetical protein